METLGKTVSFVDALSALCARLVGRGEYRPRRWLATVGATIIACTLVCGWYYYRTWSEYGTVTPRFIDLEERVRPWYTPGYRTAEDFARFGQSLTDPFFSGTDSLADALYSTMWGDGRRGGGAVSGLFPPWNYDLMAGGYVLAVAPALLILVGACATVVNFIRRPQIQSFTLIGLGALMLAAIVYENVLHPYITVAKSWYALPAMVSLCAFAAQGFDVICRRLLWLRPLLLMVVCLWALNAYASFWISRWAPQANGSMGWAAMVQDEPKQAALYLQRAIEIDPQYAPAHYTLGLVADRRGDHERAAEHGQRAVSADPAYADAHFRLASAQARLGQMQGAIEHVDRAIGLAPDHRHAHGLAARLLRARNRLDEAIVMNERALRINPTHAHVHVDHAMLLGQARQWDKSLLHCLYALQLAMGDRQLMVLLNQMLDEHARNANRLIAEGRSTEGIRLLDAVVRIGAAHGGKRSGSAIDPVALAQEICRLTDHGNPQLLDSLAAAYAAAGRYGDAQAAAQQALDQAQAQGRLVLAGTIRDHLAAYRHSKSYPFDSMSPAILLSRD